MSKLKLLQVFCVLLYHIVFFLMIYVRIKFKTEAFKLFIYIFFEYMPLSKSLHSHNRLSAKCLTYLRRSTFVILSSYMSTYISTKAFFRMRYAPLFIQQHQVSWNYPNLLYMNRFLIIVPLVYKNANHHLLLVLLFSQY